MPYFLSETGRQAEGGRRDSWFEVKERMTQSYGRLAGGREKGDVKRLSNSTEKPPGFGEKFKLVFK